MIWEPGYIDREKSEVMDLSYRKWRNAIRTQTIGIALNTVSACINLIVLFPPNHWINLINAAALALASWSVYNSARKFEEIHKITVEAVYNLAFIHGKLAVIKPVYKPVYKSE